MGEDLTPASERRRWLALLLLVCALVGLAHREALDVGLFADDYIQHAMLTGSYPGRGYAPFDLYAFLRPDPELQVQHVARGTAPWWSVVAGDPDAGSGTIVFAVLRPLSSALLCLDDALAPLDRAWALRARHLHSLVWLWLTIAAAGLVFRRLLAPRMAALALVLFACDAGLVVPLAWLANRCVLVSASFGLLGVWAHARRRAGPRGVGPSELDARGARRAWIVELACMSLALAGGEYGLLAVAYVFAWELVVGRGALVERARALGPAVGPALIYLAVHQALGYGTFGEAYADMFGAPGRWLARAGERAVKLAASGFWAVPPETEEVSDAAMPWLTELRVGAEAKREPLVARGVLLGVAGLVVALVRAGLTKQERRVVGALLLGALFGLVPITAAPAQARLLIVSQLGFCAAVAAAIMAAVRLARGRAPDSSTRPGWVRRLLPLPFAVVLAYRHGVADVHMGRRYVADIHAIAQPSLDALARGDVHDMIAADPEALRERDVIVLNAVDLATGLHGGFMLEAEGAAPPRSWRSLAMGPYALAVTRWSPDSLELWTVHGAWLATTFEYNFRRTDQPLRAGDVRDRGGLRVDVLDDLDGHPTRVRFEFPVSVDDPRYLFLISTERGLQRWSPPKVGGHGIVPVPRLP